jgi:hypothetical protein
MQVFGMILSDLLANRIGNPELKLPSELLSYY